MTGSSHKSPSEQVTAAFERLQGDVDALYDRLSTESGYAYGGFITNEDRGRLRVYNPEFSRLVYARRPSTVSMGNVANFLRDLRAGVSDCGREAGPLAEGQEGYTAVLLELYAPSGSKGPADTSHKLELKATRNAQGALETAQVAVTPLIWESIYGPGEWTDGRRFEVLSYEDVRRGLPDTAPEAIALAGIVHAMAAVFDQAKLA